MPDFSIKLQILKNLIQLYLFQAFHPIMVIRSYRILFNESCFNLSFKNLAVEFAKKQIRVNSVSPGWILGKKSSENLKKYNSKKMKSEIEDRYPLGLGSADDIAILLIFYLVMTLNGLLVLTS